MTGTTSNSEKKIGLLIVDDHHIVRSGLTSLINSESDMQVLAEANDGQKAIDLFRQLKPDVTLMDLRLPVVSGVEATIAIRKEFPDAKILVLTTYDGDEDIYRALQAGASGYLLKGMFAEELLEAIRAVNSGMRRIPAAIAERLAARLGVPELTAREVD
ncbi:MAG: response regulator, partial [Blastocatellia bacterium]